jgi:alkanesulfonate monooxygenase SsuD/methylene tetrahydromethanopterin reductase-like flavin-dependent oxidoreductase (luciferase family)
MSRDDLTFGWFLPTSGDTTCFGDPAARIPQSSEVFDEIVTAVDEGGYKYLLMPVNATCWEATVVGSYYAARTKNMAPLVALRSGYCNPTLAAKMFATLDQMSGGRLCINLIAGISDDDTRADGILDTKEIRYEKMDEEVEIMKKLWAASGAIDHQGKHYSVTQAIEPKPLQRPHRPSSSGVGRNMRWRFRRSMRRSIFSGVTSRKLSQRRSAISASVPRNTGGGMTFNSACACRLFVKRPRRLPGMRPIGLSPGRRNSKLPTTGLVRERSKGCVRHRRRTAGCGNCWKSPAMR